MAAPVQAVDRVTVGDYEAIRVSDTRFGVDGGAMFHIIPRTLWERKVTPDARHRVFIGLNCLLLRGHGRTILYDAGIGNKLSDKLAGIYGLDRETTLLRSLERAGVRPEEVDTVIPSHLHLDHAGWLTSRDAAGALVPTFPRARVIIQTAEWEGATHPNELTAASYVEDDFLPLKAAGLVDLVDGDAEIAPGVTARKTAAHCAGHQVLVVESQGASLLCPCELVPTSWHLRVPWLTCYDNEPMAVLEIKRFLLEQAAEKSWMLFLTHEPDAAFGRVERVSDKDYAWHPITAA